MKNDDLSKVKYIGPVRMKRLNDSGITTVDQLCDLPLEKLAQIDGIGQTNAKRIQEAAAAHCAPAAPAEETATDEAIVDKPPKKSKVDQSLQKQVKLLKRRLKQTNEKLKPLGDKKYLALYVDCKKRSKRLMVQLKGISRLEDGLAKKDKRKIIKKADALNIVLKSTGKKPKKKVYNHISQELRSFTEIIKTARS